MKKKTKIVESKPHPVTEWTDQERIDYVLRQFKYYIDGYTKERADFSQWVEKYGPSYTIESAGDAVRLEFVYHELKKVVISYEAKQSTLADNQVYNRVLLTNLVNSRLADLTQQLLKNWMRANSTSPLHNAVQEEKRQGACTVVDILQSSILALTKE